MSDFWSDVLFNVIAIGGAVGMVVYMLVSTKLQEKKAKRRADEMLPDEVNNGDEIRGADSTSD